MFLDYYSFGMTMPGRVYVSANRFRYGFNGKEKDDEWKSDGNEYDYGMRVYDPRLCKFMSVDPLTKKYPELTPYQFASDRPIQFIDIDGKEGEVPTIPMSLKLAPLSAGLEAIPSGVTQVAGAAVELFALLYDASSLLSTVKFEIKKQPKTEEKDEDYNEEEDLKQLEDFDKVLEGKTKSGTSPKENAKGIGKEIGQQEEEIEKQQEKNNKQGKPNKIYEKKKSQQGTQNEIKNKIPQSRSEEKKQMEKDGYINIDLDHEDKSGE